MVYLSITISYPSTQFEKLYGPFVNLGVRLPSKHNSPLFFMLMIDSILFFIPRSHAFISSVTCSFSYLMT